MLALTEIRDGVLIAAAISLSLVVFTWIVVLLIAGRLSWRAVRALRRGHDRGLVPVLQRVQQQQEAWREQGPFDPGGIASLLLSLPRRVPRRRKRKKRWFGVLLR